jgi:hypothetical protein
MKEAGQGLDVDGAAGRQNHQSAELRDCDRLVDVSDRACRDGHQHLDAVSSASVIASSESSAAGSLGAVIAVLPCLKQESTSRSETMRRLLGKVNTYPRSREPDDNHGKCKRAPQRQTNAPSRPMAGRPGRTSDPRVLPQDGRTGVKHCEIPDLQRCHRHGSHDRDHGYQAPTRTRCN